MLVAPLRLLGAFGERTPIGIVAAISVSTVVFSATPFLIPAVAADYSVSVGTVGLISTAQLGGFCVASWGAGRALRPRRRLLFVAALGGAAVNVASALTPWFGLLLAFRFVSGLTLGLTAWIAWAEAFGDDRRVGDIAAIGPIVGTIASPIIALVIDDHGPAGAYFVLAALHVVPLLMARSVRLDLAKRPPAARHRPTRAALAILVSLGVMTLGGSAVFVYAGAIGHEAIGLGALPLSLAFAANALAGIPSARYRGNRGWSAAWVGVCAVSALAVGTITTSVVFWCCLMAWGFAYWMAVPRAFAILAERSLYPDERAGDAQAVMAAGRVVGPILGGAMYAISPGVLSVVGATVIAVSAVALAYVEWRIRPIAPVVTG